MLIVSAVYLVDWYVFWNKNESIATTDYLVFQQMYSRRFPGLINDIISNHFIILIWAALLIFSGILFIKLRKTYYVILAILSFVMAGQFLFSIM